jgi:hypothetical protein
VSRGGAGVRPDVRSKLMEGGHNGLSGPQSTSTGKRGPPQLSDIGVGHRRRAARNARTAASACRSS